MPLPKKMHFQFYVGALSVGELIMSIPVGRIHFPASAWDAMRVCFAYEKVNIFFFFKNKSLVPTFERNPVVCAQLTVQC